MAASAVPGDVSLTHLDRELDEEGTYKQVHLQLWHPGCWTIRVTEQFPRTHVIERSLYPADDVVKGDFVLASEGEADVEEMLETIDGFDVVRSVTVLKQSPKRARVVVTYCRKSSIVPDIVNSEFMPIEPVHITGGIEYWTVMVDAEALGDVVQEMREEHDIAIEAIETVDPQDEIKFADVVDQIYVDLSRRQQECLFTAREEGYYEWPRDVTAGDIAEAEGVSGPTLLEHVRSGEHKVLHAVLDQIERRHTQF